MQRITLLLIIALFCSFQAILAQKQYIVTDLSDLPDEDMEDGIWYPKTLRAAIQNINKEGLDAYISVYPPWSTINLTSNLPSINLPVTFHGDGVTLKPATGAVVYIGLDINANGTKIRNIKFQNFDIGISWDGNDGVIEKCNFENIDNGINMTDSKRNRIGSDSGGYYSNYFFGHKEEPPGGYSIVISGSGSADNIIYRCAIGIDPSENAVPNSGGILIDEAYTTSIISNLICNSHIWGIEVRGNQAKLYTKIKNNRIGIDRQGIKAMPNYLHGIYLEKSSNDSIIRNVISGNGGDGIRVNKGENFYPEYIVIEDNIIGTDKSTKVAVPNGQSGISLSAENCIIKRNIISGNAFDGLVIFGPNNIVMSNIIGLDTGQTVAVPNKADGIGVNYTSNLIIGDTTGKNPNIIAGNFGDGISVSGTDQSNIQIAYNIIGTNKLSNLMLPNLGSGISLEERISYVWIKNNIISSSGEHGIKIEPWVKHYPNNSNPDEFYKPTKVYISNCNISGDIVGDGIFMHNVEDITINNNIFLGVKGDGIHIENDSTRDIMIYNNQIGPAFGKPLIQNILGDGIFIERAKNITIGMPLTPAGQITDSIRNCHGSGIACVNADSIWVLNTLFQGIAQNGIYISGPSWYEINILRCKIGSDKETDEEQKIDGDGVLVEDAVNVNIGNSAKESDSNNIRYCKGHGISVRKAAYRVYSYYNFMMGNEKGGIALGDLFQYYSQGKYDDNLDIDSGPNGLQNTISLDKSEAIGNEAKIKGIFHGEKSVAYTADVYLAKKLHDSIQYKTQGSIYLTKFFFITDDKGVAVIDTSWSNNVIGTYSATYPFVTLLVSKDEGSSGFSIISLPLVYVDIETEIDSSKTKVDDKGNVTLVANIKNLGTGTATTVEVRDTVSNYNLKNVTVSKGIAMIVDSSFIATIPSLASGESVEFTTYGQPNSPGIYLRRVVAIPSDYDVNPDNNADTVILRVDTVNSVNDELTETGNISLVDGRTARITGHGGGNITVRLYDLLGQMYYESRYEINPEQAIAINLTNRITLVEVIKENRRLIKKVICSW